MPFLSHVKVVKVLFLFTLILGSTWGVTSSTRATEIDFDTYAAIAYSPSTGDYGYAWNQPTRGYAEHEALSVCTAKDARIVGWVKGGWLVLAIGENNGYGVGWEYGDGAVNTAATIRARNECYKQGEKVKTYVRICSGDIDPEIIK